mmetsp:Transcript_20281/g.46811  ORF Transcript_20281/g.46811 Transcript_20281/m.46811 type:complete len:230 (-) Transcript_20281:177-866(-)|eukprot:CAMPEP_0172000160 /NCGR_PEP_ID=MMETSP1041-20130122/2160_1 /TAXON_ID=464988 /ORGANISM="Hemiselmis andersenii, Strain CCMP439" /LENGTH=229 /DNA_ID=CAMNT_0012653659 /DNA_START=82 /DNA_END=774 /DNA_ORIENTATION=-
MWSSSAQHRHMGMLDTLTMTSLAPIVTAGATRTSFSTIDLWLAAKSSSSLPLQLFPISTAFLSFGLACSISDTTMREKSLPFSFLGLVCGLLCRFGTRTLAPVVAIASPTGSHSSTTRFIARMPWNEMTGTPPTAPGLNSCTRIVPYSVSTKPSTHEPLFPTLGAGGWAVGSAGIAGGAFLRRSPFRSTDNVSFRLVVTLASFVSSSVAFAFGPVKVAVLLSKAWGTAA